MVCGEVDREIKDIMFPHMHDVLDDAGKALMVL